MTANDNSSWKIFSRTDQTPRNALERLPASPPWRPQHGGVPKAPPDVADFDGDPDLVNGVKFQITEEMEEAVNAALYLRRPLLLSGNPGTGKSSLIRAVAHQLRLGPVLRWRITSKSVLREGLYQYDALARLYEHQTAQADRGKDSGTEQADRDKDSGRIAGNDVGEFLRLGPVGTALYPRTGDISGTGKRYSWPRALLIDELDKSDIDLPNDLLHVLEEGSFEIPELMRQRASTEPATPRTSKVLFWNGGPNERMEIKGGKVECDQFPFVVITSNSEREFPAPFLRRCIQLTIEDPKGDRLREIIEAQLAMKLGPDGKSAQLNEGGTPIPISDSEGRSLLEIFEEARDKDAKLAVDQLMNALYLVISDKTGQADKKRLTDLLYRSLGT
jgi:MoxR-like ATPase